MSRNVSKLIRLQNLPLASLDFYEEVVKVFSLQKKNENFGKVTIYFST